MTARKVLLDSSAWIELLARGTLAQGVEREMAGATLVVPTVVLFEVYRKIKRNVSEDQALSAAAFMSQHDVTALDAEVSLHAADLSIEHSLAMADSIILAHAEAQNATIVTLDNDFASFSKAKVLRQP
ncbi:MAG: type II toxin-antitoxin system VapC family toxin [Myxococcota bacterium]